MNTSARNGVFAVVMAGGRGTRLWPLSTTRRPKAFLSFDDTGVSLLQRTIFRLSPVTALNNIFVVAGQTHEKELRLQAGNIPDHNIILEPVGRGTLPCIGLAGLYIRRRDPSSIMMIFPGEQLIEDEAKFQALMLHAAEVARNYNCVITLGIKPTNPATRFGYVHLGDKIPGEKGFRVFKSLGFTEKPDEQTAMEFVSSGRYLWNSGIFIWPVSLLFEMILKYTPDTYKTLSEIDRAIGTPEEKEFIKQIYPDMQSISIDYAIMERMADALVIPADISWNDMGTWPEVAEVWEKDGHENACFGQHVGMDSTGCVIYSPEKLVATVGVRDLIVVETPDAILICAKDRADDVKAMVQKLTEESRRTDIEDKYDTNADLYG